MPARKFNFGKVAIVLFLTVLIWVWADLALDETVPERPAVVVVDETTDPKLWVSFRQADAIDVKVTLTGPHSGFVALDRQLRKQQDSRLRFVFNAPQEQMGVAGNHSLRLLAFLQKDKELKRFGLKVKSCEPDVADVNVVALVEKVLPVECFDEDGVGMTVESIEPARIRMLAPESQRTAQVRLNQREVAQARQSAVEKRPYIVLGKDQSRQSAVTVKVRLPAEQSPLSAETVTGAKLGIALSANLQGKYGVEVTNLSEVLSPIKIRATASAKQAYEAMLYQVTLEIDDDDIKQQDPRKQVRYNFPEEFIRNNQIRLDQPAVQARFKLTPITPPG